MLQFIQHRGKPTPLHFIDYLPGRVGFKSTQFLVQVFAGGDPVHMIFKDDISKDLDVFLVLEKTPGIEKDLNERRVSKDWQPRQVSLLIEAVEDAFKSWQIIREEQAAKDFLIAMIPTREKKQGQKDGQKQKPRPTLADPNAPVP